MPLFAPQSTQEHSGHTDTCQRYWDGEDPDLSRGNGPGREQVAVSAAFHPTFDIHDDLPSSPRGPRLLGTIVDLEVRPSTIPRTFRSFPRFDCRWHSALPPRYSSRFSATERRGTTPQIQCLVREFLPRPAGRAVTSQEPG